MQPELLIAVLAGLGGMLGWGLADFFAKKTIDAVGDLVSLVWAHLFGTTLFFFVFLYQVFIAKQTVHIPSDPGVWILLVFFGTLQALVYFLAYQGFGKGPIAVLNPVFASYAGLAALISILFLGEKVELQRIIPLFVIFVGILFISTDFKALLAKKMRIAFGTPGIKEVFSASIFAAFWTVFWDKFVGGHDWILYAFFMYAFMTIAIVFLARAKNTKLAIKKPYIWKFLFLIGFSEVVAYLAISLGFSATSFTSVVAILSGAFSLPTIILARIFLKERLSAIQTLGAAIIILGIIMLSLR